MSRSTRRSPGFAHALAHKTGLSVLDESPESKVLLLGRPGEERYLPGLGPSMPDPFDGPGGSP